MARVLDALGLELTVRPRATDLGLEHTVRPRATEGATRRRGARSGRVFNNGVLAGTLSETPTGLRFVYDLGYLADPAAPPISLTLPRRVAPYESRHLFPFFFGLLAEGDAAQLQCRLLKLDEDDHFGRALATLGGDVIGSVTMVPAPERGSPESTA